MRTSILRRTPAGLTAVIATLLLVSLLPVSAAQAADHGPGSSDAVGSADATSKATFGLGPAQDPSATSTLNARVFLDYQADAGATLKDGVTLYNLEPTPVRLKVYASDAFEDADGQFAVPADGSELKDAGSWVKLDLPADGMVTVPARTDKAYGRLVVPLQAVVPGDAVPGDHVASIVASLLASDNSTQGGQSSTVNLDQRVAVRAYFRVAGDLRPQLTVENLRATYHPKLDPLGRGRVTVTYTVRNTGNMRLNATQVVRVSRLVRADKVAHPRKILDILPGASLQFTVDFPNSFGLFPMKATVTLHPAPVRLGDDAPVHDFTASKRFWAWPWLLLAEILGAILVLTGASVWWRHRQKKKARPSGGGPDGRDSGPDGPGSSPKSDGDRSLGLPAEGSSQRPLV